MKVTVKFIGPMRKLNHWKSIAKIELAENATGVDLFKALHIDPDETKPSGFLILNGKKLRDQDLIHDGDQIKLLTRTSGG